jgi:hypothetical protein
VRRLAQHGGAFGLKAAGLIQRIVAHPDFKQVAQQEHGIGGVCAR